MRERQIVAVVAHEPLWMVVADGTVLLCQVGRVVAVSAAARSDRGNVAEVLTPGVRGLHQEPARELLPHRNLQTVVAGPSVKGGFIVTGWQITQNRHAQRSIGYG